GGLGAQTVGWLGAQADSYPVIGEFRNARQLRFRQLGLRHSPLQPFRTTSNHVYWLSPGDAVALAHDPREYRKMMLVVGHKISADSPMEAMAPDSKNNLSVQLRNLDQVLAPPTFRQCGKIAIVLRRGRSFAGTGTKQCTQARAGF